MYHLIQVEFITISHCQLFFTINNLWWDSLSSLKKISVMGQQTLELWNAWVYWKLLWTARPRNDHTINILIKNRERQLTSFRLLDNKNVTKLRQRFCWLPSSWLLAWLMNKTRCRMHSIIEKPIFQDQMYLFLAVKANQVELLSV